MLHKSIYITDISPPPLASFIAPMSPLLLLSQLALRACPCMASNRLRGCSPTACTDLGAQFHQVGVRIAREFPDAGKVPKIPVVDQMI